MNNKRKILFVLWSLSAGGAERSLINLLWELDYGYYDVELFLFEREGEFLNQLPEQIRLIETPKMVKFLSTGSFREMMNNFSLRGFFYRMLYKLFYEKKAKSSYNKDQLLWDKVWKKSLESLKGEYDIAAGYLQGIPNYFVIDKVTAERKLLWIHTDYSKINGDIDFDYRYFCRGDEIITISEICKEALLKNFSFLKDKINLLYNINSPVLIKRLAEEVVPKEIISAKEEGHQILLSIGRLVEVKGFDIAIKAAAILRNRGVKYKWFILGEGRLRQELLELISINSLQDFVFLLGVKSNPYSYISQADIVVQTSRYEGKSMVLDEAKALCKPIISTNYSSATDQIDQGKTGILVGMSPEEVAKGVEEVLSDKDIRKLLTDNLSKLDFSYKMELDKYLASFNGMNTIW
ncbi:MAG: glycosyltransferase [Clostridiaceae bacterium]